MPSPAIAEDSGSVRIIVAIEEIALIVFRHQHVVVKYSDIKGSRDKKNKCRKQNAKPDNPLIKNARRILAGGRLTKLNQLNLMKSFSS